MASRPDIIIIMSGPVIAQGASLQPESEAEPGSEALWGRLDRAFQDFAGFRDASLDRWHRKADLASGQSLLRSGGLKALNQPISAQVCEMKDPASVQYQTLHSICMWMHTLIIAPPCNDSMALLLMVRPMRPHSYALIPCKAWPGLKSAAAVPDHCQDIP